MSLLFGDSYFEVDQLKDSKIYFIRQVNILDNEIAIHMEYDYKMALEYQIANFNAKYLSYSDGHGFFGFEHKEDAQNAANWLEGLIIAAILKSKNKN